MLSLLLIVFTSVLTSLGNIQQKPVPGTVLVSGMVKVPAGNYTLFFENKTGKTVRVKAFYLDVRAVTNAEYLEFVKANPQWAKSKVSKLYADAGYLKHWAADLNPGQ